MRTTKLFTMVAAVIAAGFLVVATTSNAAFAQTSTSSPSTSASATSSISQSNTQSATCTAGTSNTASCNQLAINFNKGNAVSAAQAYTGGLGTDPTSNPPSTSATASSSISQTNDQKATCTAGTSNSFSCNQLAANVNFGNAVSAAIASFGQ
jgi:hypothetical protein